LKVRPFAARGFALCRFAVALFAMCPRLPQLTARGAFAHPSGLEDFFLGSNFHSMPNYQLPVAGFYLDNSSTVSSTGWRNGLPNALSAYRIMNDEPIFFKDSLRFQWQPHGEQASLAATHPISCNRDWPQQDGPSHPPDAQGNSTVGTVAISSLAYLYTWS
jgi:hypothetical protein